MNIKITRMAEGLDTVHTHTHTHTHNQYLPKLYLQRKHNMK